VQQLVKMNSTILKKARKLIKENRVRLTFNGRNAHFEVKGKTKLYNIMKTQKGYNCTCYWFTTFCKDCSHIESCRMHMESIKNAKKSNLERRKVDMPILQPPMDNTGSKEGRIWNGTNELPMVQEKV